MWYLIVSIPDLCTITYFYFKNDNCAFQKSFAIRTDGVLFKIILACFALAAILGIMQHKFKKSSLEKKVFFAPIHQIILDKDFKRYETNASRLFLD